MFKRIMLAGLMSATVLGGIVPAYAQERAPRGERGMRNGDGAAVSRGNRMNQPRGDAGRNGHGLLAYAGHVRLSSSGRA